MFDKLQLLIAFHFGRCLEMPPPPYYSEGWGVTSVLKITEQKPQRTWMRAQGMLSTLGAVVFTCYRHTKPAHCLFRETRTLLVIKDKKFPLQPWAFVLQPKCCCPNLCPEPAEALRFAVVCCLSKLQASPPHSQERKEVFHVEGLHVLARQAAVCLLTARLSSTQIPPQPLPHLPVMPGSEPLSWQLAFQRSFVPNKVSCPFHLAKPV